MPTLFDKLNLKKQRGILVLNAPQSLEGILGDLSGVHVLRRIDDASEIEFALIFATRKNEVEELAKAVVPRLIADGVLWFAYPKGTSRRYTCDFNRDTGWESLAKLGFDSVRQVAIDEDWSALRFRRIEFIQR